MLKILTGSEVRNLDRNHVQNHGVSSLMLMEKAALGFVGWWKGQPFQNLGQVAIFCGAGNNGGDGFAIARLLSKEGFQVHVFFCFESDTKLSPDAKSNFDLLPSLVKKSSWKEFNPSNYSYLIDAYLGVGLKGDLRHEASLIIEKINSFSGKIIAVDIPSGLPSEGVGKGKCVNAEFTVTFAFPKLSLLFPENSSYSGELVLVDIGILEEEYGQFESPFYFLQKKDIPALHRSFSKFSHKGDFGKILLVAGSKGKMGASILAAKSALRTGSGLVTCFCPEEERSIIQTAVPEAMVWTGADLIPEKFDAIGIGPGIGVEKVEFLKDVLKKSFAPLVLDADALTILADHSELISLIPKGSILTPHQGEFERIFGKCENQFVRLNIAREFCAKNQLNMLIKGANSVICLSDGRQIFNSSGTKYMATGGSGDVLTGMLTSFLGQGYTPEQALICGVYQHGLAGEFAGNKKFRSTIATDIIEEIPESFKFLSIS